MPAIAIVVLAAALGIMGAEAQERQVDTVQTGSEWTQEILVSSDGKPVFLPLATLEQIEWAGNPRLGLVSLGIDERGVEKVLRVQRNVREMLAVTEAPRLSRRGIPCAPPAIREARMLGFEKRSLLEPFAGHTIVGSVIAIISGSDAQLRTPTTRYVVSTEDVPVDSIFSLLDHSVLSFFREEGELELNGVAFCSDTPGNEFQIGDQVLIQSNQIDDSSGVLESALVLRVDGGQVIVPETHSVFREAGRLLRMSEVLAASGDSSNNG